MAVDIIAEVAQAASGNGSSERTKILADNFKHTFDEADKIAKASLTQEELQTKADLANFAGMAESGSVAYSKFLQQTNSFATLTVSMVDKFSLSGEVINGVDLAKMTQKDFAALNYGAFEKLYKWLGSSPSSYKLITLPEGYGLYKYKSKRVMTETIPDFSMYNNPSYYLTFSWDLVSFQPFDHSMDPAQMYVNAILKDSI